MINLCIRLSTHKQIIKDFSKCKDKDIDCILVLGAGIIDNNRPTLMLKDRIEKSIELYKKGTAPKIIMSGDHRKNRS